MPFGPRQLLEHRISEISTELELLFEGACDHARREQAEQLNQAVRRLRIAPDPGELCATLADAAARLASGTILFRVAEGTATSDRIEVPLGDAPALAAAAESQDPLIAAATPGEVSAPLVELLGHTPDMRVSILPVVAGEKVAALVYCWGTVQVAALELLAQVASAVWSAIPVPPPRLVSIAMAADPPPVQAKPAAAWQELPPAEQQIHLRAQRFARVQAAEMRLYHAEVVQVARGRRNLYEALRQPIDDARQAFRTRFFAGCPSMVDYLHLELTRTLANDDPDLLGSTYPGPLV
jgi:pyruvate/2-oxoglutarate dehydrogenase complex dihydrolipoamide acyltransferase (E2) component